MITAARLSIAAEDGNPGEIILEGDRLRVTCADHSALELLELQPEGKRRMPAADFIRGYRPQSGEKLGS